MVRQATSSDCVCVCSGPVQVQLLQREAELAEATTAADSRSQLWGKEQQSLQEAASKWRGKALELQEEVNHGMNRNAPWTL